MNRDLLERTMSCRGITQDDFDKLLREGTPLTDITIFTISRFLNEIKGINVFFTKKIGEMTVKVRFIDIAVDYQFYNSKNELMAAVCVNLDLLTLFVEFPELKQKLNIGDDLMKFGKLANGKVWNLRMQVLNEALTRYYAKLLYNVYIELQRRR